jgi:ADP-ribosylglycohydrolase
MRHVSARPARRLAGRALTVLHDVADLREMLAAEIVQRRESGHVVDDPVLTEPASEQELVRHLAAVEAAPRDPAWPYAEPSDPTAIAAARPPAPARAALLLDDATLDDRISGAWLGRCAGCALGKPVESWSYLDVRRYAEATGAWPIADYLPAPEPIPHGFPAFHPSWRRSTRGRLDGMPRDDDLDYTVLALLVLEEHGLTFTAEDVGRAWLARLPFLGVYTAERAAYRNLVLGVRPPATATLVNPYREWIGAQIRADLYGYVSPGDPERAAGLAFRDASVSHTANGLYGCMWAAALVAAAFAEPSMATALDSALALIPARSRLAQALREVVAAHAAGTGWGAAREALEARHGALSPVHTINNAAVVAAALLWGHGDFTRTVGLAVAGGWDTDCNGATAGSAFGAMHGAAALPDHWTAPLDDRLATALAGVGDLRISALARRTLDLVRGG